jgi:hypothetical protein
MPKICWQITQGSNQAKLSKLKTQLQPELPGQQWEAQQEQIWYPRVGGPLLLPLRSWMGVLEACKNPQEKRHTSKLKV